MKNKEEKKLPKHVYLMGFMGCGKTKIGSLLAKELNRPFIDTDEKIMEETGLTINEIFKQYGEKGFREIEKNVIRALAQTRGCIISLGGGSVIHPENWANITQSGITITLSYPPEVLANRLEHKTDRPLLNETTGAQRLERIREMLQMRAPYYQRADLVLHLNREVEPEVVAHMLIEFLKEIE